MAKIIDLVGLEFGRLKVVNYSHTKNSKVHWDCVCVCGSKFCTSGTSLKGGHTKSCGCLRSETTSASMSTHRLSNHPLHEVWKGMKARCRYKNHTSYPYYGGRGITVCDEWVNDFKAFYDWCILNGWKQGLTIGRKNNDGNYEPSNCRIETKKEQARNKSNTLTWTKVRVIRNLFQMGAFTRNELSVIYGTSKSSIKKIIANKTWV